VLDGPHTAMLRAVAKGAALPEPPPPALQRLEATGLVMYVDGRWAVTEAGRLALGPDPEGGSDLRSKITAWFTT
jgi:hypothetical protein